MLGSMFPSRRARFGLAAFVTLLFSTGGAPARPPAPVSDPVPAPALPSSPEDTQWAGGFFRAGVNGEVRAFTAWDGALYAGGSFTVAGPIAAAGIARWDGSAWSPLSSGMNARVSALVEHDGSLVAGGLFTEAGGVTVSRVARWDGTSWSPLGQDLDGEVRSLAVSAGVLYAGGNFTLATAVTVNRIARWDGSSWQPLGSGMNGEVVALTEYGSSLVAAGAFTQAGGIAANHVARWDGTSWSPLGSGTNDRVYSLCVHDGDLIAGGAFEAAGGQEALHIARWNGSAWGPIGGGFDDMFAARVFALATFDGDLIAGGEFANSATLRRIARWDGTAWRAMQDGVNGSLGDLYTHVSALGVFDGRLFAGGGDFFEAGDVPASNIAAWDGVVWSALGEQGLGTDGSVLSLMGDAGALFAGGEFEHAGTLSAPSIAALGEVGWSALGGGFPGKTWAGALAHHGGAPVAGVSHWEFVPEQGFPLPPEVFHWDGASWTSLGMFHGDEFPDIGSEICALAEYGGDLVVAGRFLYQGWELDEVNHLARWDGTAWHSIGGGATQMDPYSPTQVDAIVVSGSDLVVGGRFMRVGNVPASRIARWDGSAWHALGGGVNDWVYCLAMFNGELIAGGEFTQAGGAPASRIARWDGSAWHPLAGGVTGSGASGRTMVNALAVHDGALIVGGNFGYAGGIPARSIARWDGTSWSALGSGINGLVHALESMDGHLYVGGGFTTAGGKPSYGIARWTADGPVAVTLDPAAPPARLALSARPNPFASTAAITFSLPARAFVRMTVHDVQGRLVATPIAEVRDAGTYSAAWDGRDARGDAVASGTYFVRLRAVDQTRTLKITLAQ